MELREIKFKAKSTFDEKWIEGDLSHYKGSVFITPTTGGYLCRSIEVDPSTVCQYTGLKDCKGNKVWEHDIIIDPYNTEYEIVYNSNIGCFAYLYNDGVGGIPFGVHMETGIYVVGNKFDKESKV